MPDLDSVNVELRQYLVGISFHTDAPGDAGFVLKDNTRRTVLSSFVFSFEGRWILCTAGHIIDDFNQIVQAGHQLRVELIASWNPSSSSTEPLAIMYVPGIAFSTSDDILDFGFITLSPQAERYLAENGVKPIDEAHWATEPDDSRFEHCTLVGLPQDLVSSQGSTSSYDHFDVGIATLELDHVFPVPDSLAKQCAWYGRIAMSEFADCPFSLNGFSGGLVAGL